MKWLSVSFQAVLLLLFSIRGRCGAVGTTTGSVMHQHVYATGSDLYSLSPQQNDLNSTTSRSKSAAAAEKDEEIEEEEDYWEWIEDDEKEICYLVDVDDAWFAEEEWYLAKAVCEDDDDDDDEEVDPAEWLRFVDPQDDLQWEMPPEMAAEYFPYDEQPNFLVPHNLRPGEVEAIRWRDTGDVVDDEEIFAVGLPKKLLKEFRSYFEETGILETVHQLLYNPEADYDSEETKLRTMNDGHKWTVKRADHWETDMVWFDPADEACYERLRSLLRKGGFDRIVQAIARQLNQPALTVHGMGAIFVSRFESSDDLHHLHRDVPDTRGAFYNILVPIYLPENGEASLYIGGDDHICSPIYLKENIATVIGSDSWHGTGECDFTADHSFRLSMSIWVSEINEETLETIATDELSPWPLHEDKPWYRAQANRNLTHDIGRAPSFDVQDTRADCHQVKDQCDTDLTGVRAQCAKTCRVYLPTDEYHAYLDELKKTEGRRTTTSKRTSSP